MEGANFARTGQQRRVKGTTRDPHPPPLSSVEFFCSARSSVRLCLHGVPNSLVRKLEGIQTVLRFCTSRFGPVSDQFQNGQKPWKTWKLKRSSDELASVAYESLGKLPSRQKIETLEAAIFTMDVMLYILVMLRQSCSFSWNEKKKT